LTSPTGEIVVFWMALTAVEDLTCPECERKLARGEAVAQCVLRPENEEDSAIVVSYCMKCLTEKTGITMGPKPRGDRSKPSRN